MSTTFRFIMCCALALSTIMASCAPAGQRIDNIPMYGQPAIPRPELLKKADEDFIKNATAGFGSREVASKAWFSEGQKFTDAGNLDYATRRYNQSWLLNPKNYQPYWGFGRVMVALEKYDEAIEYFEKAKQLIDDQYQKVALLSDTAVAYSLKASRISTSDQKGAAQYSTIANEHFQQSTTLDPSYTNSWRNWGWSLYYEGRYAEAWEMAKKARSLGDVFVPKLIEALSQKIPESQ
jgi:tetratricopeptide (TPR) repeat protein